MFDPALKPVGLYVEQGRELVHVNTKSGYGNFHMKPNGVFYISVDRAAVAETRAFLKQRPQAELATQSGPMLVIDGRLHPRFDRRSTSLKARNGVGVRADGKVIFAISQGEVSFDAFARLFRDGLNCPNALFLDGGSAASLYAPSLNRHGNILSLGPMLAVFERNRRRKSAVTRRSMAHRRLNLKSSATTPGGRMTTDQPSRCVQSRSQIQLKPPPLPSLSFGDTSARIRDGAFPYCQRAL